MQKIILFFLILLTTSALAATPHIFNFQTISLQQNVLPVIDFKTIHSERDFNNTTHIRKRQYFAGYPVFGGEIVEHYSPDAQTKIVNGKIYENIGNDLKNSNTYLSEDLTRKQASQTAIINFEKETGSKVIPKNLNINKIIFLDGDNKAHWAYLIKFLVESVNSIPKLPVQIIDASNFHIYKLWDDIQTYALVSGGGFGGNQKIGKFAYDGLEKDFPPLSIFRDTAENRCYLANKEVSVQDIRSYDPVVGFSCASPNKEHGNLYWDGEQDAANGAYSPENDALYIGHVIQAMYQQWYGTPALELNGKPLLLKMRVHWDQENAYWEDDIKKMTFGDGGSHFYPLVSLDIGAHEISHGFTALHSGLLYFGESGGLNESFSDMAAKAAEFYSTHHVNWTIGADITKRKNSALRYLDNPSKDCSEIDLGIGCSINNISQYHEGLDVHFSSGIFNRVYYLLSNSASWDPKKAFDVMVQANRYYWTPHTHFKEAACGVIAATKDYHYDVKMVQEVFTKVGITTQDCS